MTFPPLLAPFRRAIESTFTTSAEVFRKTQVVDTSGGFTDTYVSAGTYPCSFSKPGISPVETERDVRIHAISSWVFHFPSGTDIRNTDRLVVGIRTFEVVGAGEVSLSILLIINTVEII